MGFNVFGVTGRRSHPYHREKWANPLQCKGDRIGRPYGCETSNIHRRPLTIPVMAALVLLVSQSLALIHVTDSSAMGIAVEPMQRDSITLGGMILDSATGEFPAGDTFSITIDSLATAPDSGGAFSARIPNKNYHSLRVVSRRFEHFVLLIPEDTAKKEYFVTCVMRQRTNDPKAMAMQSVKGEIVSGPCWTICGCVVDSKHDVAIKSDSFHVAFDDSTIAVSKRGGFSVVTCRGGGHTFHVRIPGYHEVIEPVELKEDEKQPFITIPTTRMKNTIGRREMTVSAKREPVHVTAAVSKTQLSRKEIMRTASTLNDPARAVQTLPGVAAQSDASARPIVRGGEPRETRVFLDDITLVQPYHFGGGKSMFNELSLENMTLFKSGFPARFGNAASALLTVDSRKPLSEPFCLDLNCNLLQTDAYAGMPLYKDKIGVNASFQSSYQDFYFKRLLDLMAGLYGKGGGAADAQNRKATRQMKEDITLPDYRDMTAGVEIRPADRLRIFVNETYTTDRFKVVDRCYGCVGEANEPETLINYKSYYNVLSASARYLPASDHIFTLTGAWQKRWWDIRFPATGTSFSAASLYDVDLTQLNLNLHWLYSGISRHMISSGVNYDYNRARYDVDLARALHEVVLDGNSNFADFWGPLTRDEGLTLHSNRFNAFTTEAMIEHVFVKYRGRNTWSGAGVFGQDEWQISPRLTLDGGARVELTRADSSITLSPRISAKYSLNPNHELVAGAGHYTQNNYDISSIALSSDLKPEKVWHGSVGEEARLLPWLSQKVDCFGKYYYDLITEKIEGVSGVSTDSIYRAVFGASWGDSLAAYSPQALSDMVSEYRYSNDLLESHYNNNGRGYALGVEYFLRYDPYDFWNGWISLTLSRSMKQGNPGWRRHAFRLDRPVLFTIVNYYRLPRKYEISVKYRLMSGLPYTFVEQDSVTRVGPSDDRRYSWYQRLDFKFSKGFTIKDSKAHFYIEAWNAFNNPNFALFDRDTKRLIGFDMNMPVTMLFFGFDFQW
jgi:hypothetical protein